MTDFKALLDGIDPKLFYMLISAVVGGVIYLWRKISMSSWDWVTRKSPAVQQLPALILAGLLSAAPAMGQPLLKAIEQIILGSLVGALPAIAGHDILKSIPWIPYNGGKAPVPPPPAPAGQDVPR